MKGRVKWAGDPERQGTGVEEGTLDPTMLAACRVRESLVTRKLQASKPSRFWPDPADEAAQGSHCLQAGDAKGTAALKRHRGHRQGATQSLGFPLSPAELSPGVSLVGTNF